MELRDYQRRAVEEVRAYLRLLAETKAKAEAADLGAAFDFADAAWRLLGKTAPYHGRRDGMGGSIPAFCLKIPTGGGKTLLAVKAIDAVNTLYVKRRTGLVLWIVPTAQIYDQTLAALCDRQHPYRQHLDAASAGRTVIVEKHERFTPSDVSENLVVLMLMLQSSVRVTKEQLRMFKDNGGFQDFFPSEEARQEHADLLAQIDNLDTFVKDGFWGGQIKTSLGNTLRRLRPIMIVDEGQKAYSEGAQKTLNGFNPSVMIELSATPPDESNVLVEISGAELAQEEMIKLPLNVVRKGSPQWQDTLAASVAERESLERAARKHDAATGTYIRPICLVQAERTGEGQRERGYVHAEDVKERLLKTHHIPPEQIAIKSSEKNDLKEVDDVGGLMSRDCQVRYIITKQALQEGWDCAFAYVLAVLTNPQAEMAMTQLVGRVLRQPYAKRTGVKALDEAYVFCHRPNAGELLQEIRAGLEGEGLGDATSSIVVRDDGKDTAGTSRVSRVRPRFAKALRSFALPVFAVNVNGVWRPVRYETDVESRIPWKEIDVSELCMLALADVQEQDEKIRVGLGGVSGSRAADAHHDEDNVEIDEAYIARHVIETVPNPWAAYAFGKEVIECLAAEHGLRLVYGNFSFIVEELRKHLARKKEDLAKGIFLSRLKKGEFRFLLIGGCGRLPETADVPHGSVTLNRRDGTALEKSLHDFVPADAFNDDERSVAWYLEDQDRLFFWYRNRVKRDYSIQGWRKDRFWPDFIFSSGKGAAARRDDVYVIETKGEHLIGNLETKYKQALVELCNQETNKIDPRELPVALSSTPIRFEVLKQSEWERRLNEVFGRH